MSLHPTATATPAAYTQKPPTLSERIHDAWRKFKDSRRIQVKEEDGVHKTWYDEARKVKTPDQLHGFATRLLSCYGHDYGTICHATAAIALAGAYCANASDQGGITGFQASAIFWEFATRWQHIEGPASLIQYDDMLYPQCAYKFDKTISKETWAYIKKKASHMHFTNNSGGGLADEVRAHLLSISNGVVPFGYTVRAEDEE